MIDDVIKDAETRMTKAQQVLERELGSIRTGRAAASLLDRIVVDHYGVVFRNDDPLCDTDKPTSTSRVIATSETWVSRIRTPVVAIEVRHHRSDLLHKELLLFQLRGGPKVS